MAKKAKEKKTRSKNGKVRKIAREVTGRYGDYDGRISPADAGVGNEAEA